MNEQEEPTAGIVKASSGNPVMSCLTTAKPLFETPAMLPPPELCFIDHKLRLQLSVVWLSVFHRL